jgi:hypothetical protein
MAKNKKEETDTKKELSVNQKHHKVESLREMITSAEKTIQSAKAMLLQLEGKKKTGRKRKIEQEGDGTIVEGTFDGQIMIGTDGKQYPVPANYASKSKLVEGDMLKLTITPDGSFIYKQIGPADRKRAIGIVSQDESGNYYIIAEGKPYKVLLASVTYFKAEPGDEAAIVMPRDIDSSWASIENILQKGKNNFSDTLRKEASAPEGSLESWKDEISARGGSAHGGKDIDSVQEEKKESEKSIVDEWASDISEIEREAAQKSETPSLNT